MLLFVKKRYYNIYKTAELDVNLYIDDHKLSCTVEGIVNVSVLERNKVTQGE